MMPPPPPSKRVLTLTALALCLSLFFAITGHTARADEPASAPSPRVVIEAMEQGFIEVAERVMPSVVTVHIRGSSPAADRELQELFPDLPPMLDPAEGTGSGFVVDVDGTIFTNHHVVKDAELIQVILRDGTRYKADLVGADIESDVAVIRMLDPPEDLTAAEIGDSDAVRVGQFAIAIGSPLGFENSFTVGHVSAKERSNIGRPMPGIASPGFENLSYQDFLQVDTPINPGNSGGPLVDIRGKVIGINTAIIASGGGGIGFSIPINMAQTIASQLIAQGHVSRGWLGVTPLDVPEEIGEKHELGRAAGAYIQSVLPDTPASKAGIAQDDIIVAFNERAIHSAKDLMNAVAWSPIDKTLTCKLLRMNKAGESTLVSLQVSLAERPAPEAQRKLVQELRRTGGKDSVQGSSDRWLVQRLGLVVQTLTGRLNAKLKRRRSARGVHVLSVQQGSPAAEAGLQADDILMEANHQPLSNADDLRTAIQNAQREFIPLAIERSGAQQFLSLERP